MLQYRPKYGYPLLNDDRLAVTAPCHTYSQLEECLATARCNDDTTRDYICTAKRMAPHKKLLYWRCSFIFAIKTYIWLHGTEFVYFIVLGRDELHLHLPGHRVAKYWFWYQESVSCYRVRRSVVERGDEWTRALTECGTDLPCPDNTHTVIPQVFVLPDTRSAILFHPRPADSHRLHFLHANRILLKCNIFFQWRRRDIAVL